MTLIRFWQNRNRTAKFTAAKFALTALIAGAMLTSPLSGRSPNTARPLPLPQQMQTGR